jgi:hypothetical protein
MVEMGEGMGLLNPEWYQSFELAVTFNKKRNRWQAELPKAPFSFRFDQQQTSIEGLYPIVGKCTSFIRSRSSEDFIEDRLPKTSKVFWKMDGPRTIIFSNQNCGLRSVEIKMIPSLSDLDCDSQIAESMLENVYRRTLALMFEAKNKNVVIDKTQDGNANKIPETEINQEYLNKKT